MFHIFLGKYQEDFSGQHDSFQTTNKWLLSMG